MSGFSIVALQDLLLELNDSARAGETRVKSILSGFSCPMNADVEYFIKSKAIEFNRQSISKTYLVFTDYKQQHILVGYFTIAQKFIKVPKKGLTYSYRKRIRRFSTFDTQTEEYTLTTPLIAQLGKNFSNGYNKLITGDELLAFAIEKVDAVIWLAGGKFVYLECEDKQKLIEFYESNGFVQFGMRNKDVDEQNLVPGHYLVQMLKDLSKRNGRENNLYV